MVLRQEQIGLRRAGRHDLADPVRWTAVRDGDGFGFDIASFEHDGRERLIEVKTTNGWERTPFHVTRSETGGGRGPPRRVACGSPMELCSPTRAFALRPPVEAHAELTATSFIAALK